MTHKLALLLTLLGVAGGFASCASTTVEPPQKIAMSGGNDILIYGNHALVLANGSNALYVVDLSSVSAQDKAVLVVNEGNFGKTNSTVDKILIHSNGAHSDTTVEHDILNSSNVIATIPFGLDGPNQMAIIGPNRLLVTRRNTTSAAIVDLIKNAIVDSVPLGEPSVAVAVLDNKAYITSGGYIPPGHLNILNLSSMKVIRSIWLRNTAERAVADSTHNQVLIGTAPDYDKVSPAVYFVASNSDNIADSLEFGTPTSDGQITCGPQDFLVVAGDLYPLGAPTHTMPASLLHSASSLYKGAEYDGGLWLGVYGFTTSAGKVNVYDAATGALNSSLTTGIAPAHFAFYH